MKLFICSLLIISYFFLLINLIYSKFVRSIGNIKGSFSGLRQCLAIESPLKIMENVFKSPEKLFSKYLKILSRLFRHGEKRLD